MQSFFTFFLYFIFSYDTLFLRGFPIGHISINHEKRIPDSHIKGDYYMTYQEFKDTMIHAIQTKLGKSVKVTVQDIIKNNDTHLDGLTILSKQSNISPTIYLNSYYEQYLNGKELSAICTDILLSYKEHMPVSNIDISFFTDYEQVKDHIIFKLINYERNKELLQQVPHLRYLDLAIVFNCLLSSYTDGCATILIHHQHLSYWNISANELYEVAKKNTPSLLPKQLQSMTSVLNNMLDLSELEDIFEEEEIMIPMYILTNHKKLHGSACILYENLLAEIAEKLGSDLYILPSSIHEVLLVPSTTANSYAELSSMVREVNTTHVCREEVLSDHVYYYSRDTKKITM